MPTTWWPLVKRSHTTVLGVTDSPCGFQPWAEATCPREWRIPHWSCWERYPHLCISLVKTVSTLTWFRVLALPYPDYFAPECSTKCGHTGCLGQQEHARWQMSWQESTCCLKLEYTSLWQSLVSVPDSLWLQARSQLFSRDTAQQLLKRHSFPACNPLTPENCYLPTQQLQVCQPEHHHSLPRAKWGLRSQLSSCQGKIGDRQEALTPAHRGESAAPPGWMCSTSEHTLGACPEHHAAGCHCSALGSSSPHLPHRPPVGCNHEG